MLQSDFRNMYFLTNPLRLSFTDSTHLPQRYEATARRKFILSPQEFIMHIQRLWTNEKVE